MLATAQWLILLLGGWTLAAAAWWTLSLWLVRRQRAAPSTGPHAPSLRALSVFKPIPALRNARVTAAQRAALESFIAQSDERTQILLGIEKQDRASWQPFLDQWQRAYPNADLEIVVAPRPATFRNPKISWQHTLAERASGELWFWSDADIIAPPNLLRVVREEFAAGDCALITTPYVVRSITRAPMLLEALFVNVELYPGVLACARFGRVRSGHGAGLLFSAKSFRKHVAWEKLGARIADDFALGRTLTPVKLSAMTVETLAAESLWRDALHHSLRWRKTIRWCQPAGFAGLALVTPALGWAALVIAQPMNAVGWAGLAGTVLMETTAAALICRGIGCRLRVGHVTVLAAWSALRPLSWLACWLPWPVVFRSQRRKWWSLYRSAPWGERS